MPEYQKTKLKKVGAGWRIKSGLSIDLDMGVAGNVRVLVLKNQKKKEGSRQPDYNAYIDTGKPIEKIPEIKTATEL